MGKLLIKLKKCHFSRFKKHKQFLKRLNQKHINHFNKVYKNMVDRNIGDWQLVEIHQIPNPFNIDNEVDFWCCNGDKLVLLKIRHQPYQKFTTIHPNVKKQTPAYWIAELPIEQSQKIDDEFLLEILKIFDKNLVIKPAVKSGFGMLKTNLYAKDLDVDVAQFARDI